MSEPKESYGTPNKPSVSFLATFDNRRQNKDGDWKIVLESPLTETPNIDQLSPFFSECVVKVTVTLEYSSGDESGDEQG